MLLRTISLASAAAALAVAAPAAACDLHGPGQSGGFHRYNPFANAFNNIQSRAEQFTNSEIVRRDETPKDKAEKKKREKALDADAEAEAEKARKADLREKNQQGRGAPK